jgi:hypothetical protein
MANLLWLSFSFHRTALSPYSGFIDLGKSLGHSISAVKSGTPENVASLDSMFTQIRSADGYILSCIGDIGGDYTKAFWMRCKRAFRMGNAC